MHPNVPVERVSTQNVNLNVTCLSHKKQAQVNRKLEISDSQPVKRSNLFHSTTHALVCVATQLCPNRDDVRHLPVRFDTVGRKKRGFWNYVIFVFAEIPVRK